MKMKYISAWFIKKVFVLYGIAVQYKHL